MYAELLSTIQKDGSDIARCNFVSFDILKEQETPNSNTRVRKYYSQSPINPLECEEIFLYHPAIWSNLYKKDLLDNNNIRMPETPGASFQDNAFLLETVGCAKKISLINKDFYHYRLHANQSIRSSKVWFYEKINEKARSFLATIQDKELAERLSIIYFRRSLYNYEYSLQTLSKDEIPKMCHFILNETRKIPRSWVDRVCVTKREKFFI